MSRDTSADHSSPRGSSAGASLLGASVGESDQVPEPKDYRSFAHSVRRKHLLQVGSERAAGDEAHTGPSGLDLQANRWAGGTR